MRISMGPLPTSTVSSPSPMLAPPPPFSYDAGGHTSPPGPGYANPSQQWKPQAGPSPATQLPPSSFQPAAAGGFGEQQLRTSFGSMPQQPGGMPPPPSYSEAISAPSVFNSVQPPPPQPADLQRPPPAQAPPPYPGPAPPAGAAIIMPTRKAPQPRPAGASGGNPSNSPPPSTTAAAAASLPQNAPAWNAIPPAASGTSAAGSWMPGATTTTPLGANGGPTAAAVAAAAPGQEQGAASGTSTWASFDDDDAWGSAAPAAAAAPTFGAGSGAWGAAPTTVPTTGSSGGDGGLDMSGVSSAPAANPGAPSDWASFGDEPAFGGTGSAFAAQPATVAAVVPTAVVPKATSETGQQAPAVSTAPNAGFESSFPTSTPFGATESAAGAAGVVPQPAESPSTVSPMSSRAASPSRSIDTNERQSQQAGSSARPSGDTQPFGGVASTSSLAADNPFASPAAVPAAAAGSIGTAAALDPFGAAAAAQPGSAASDVSPAGVNDPYAAQAAVQAPTGNNAADDGLLVVEALYEFEGETEEELTIAPGELTKAVFCYVGCKSSTLLKEFGFGNDSRNVVCSSIAWLMAGISALL